MRKIYFWFYIVWLSFKWIFKFNLGDLVIYGSKKYVLIQGAASPYWNLREYNGDSRIAHIHQKEFSKVRTVKNIMGSFLSGYSFYMGYWFDIWVNEGVKPWMKQCKIW